MSKNEISTSTQSKTKTRLQVMTLTLFGAALTAFGIVSVSDMLSQNKTVPVSVPKHETMLFDQYQSNGPSEILAANKIDELEKLSENTRWIIELKKDAVLHYAENIKNEKLNSTELSTRLDNHRTEIKNEQAELLAQLPTTLVEKRSTTEVANIIAVEGTSESLHNIIDDPRIQNIYLDNIVYPTMQDVVPTINADDAWNELDQNSLPVKGDGITVAVLDSGIDYTHSDFGGCTTEQFTTGQCAKFVGGYDLWDDDNDPLDEYGHGTHVAGIIASEGAISGVAPHSKLYAYRVLGSSSDDNDDVLSLGTLSSVIAGIEMAMDPNQDGDTSDHADVIHMSLGASGSPNDLWAQTVDAAVDNGAVVTVSAGNNGSGFFTVGSPGNARKALTVGATCKAAEVGLGMDYCDTEMATFSSRGPTMLGHGKPDVVAPGVRICSAKSNFMSDDAASHGYNCIDDSHYSYSGTSMSGPVVAGVAALVSQSHPDWTPQQIKNTIKGTAVDLGFHYFDQGMGLVDAYSAVVSENSFPLASILYDASLYLDGIVEITGTATDSDFDHYVLEYGDGHDPEEWVEVTNSQVAVLDGVLGVIDAANATEGISVRLTVFDLAGQQTIDHAFYLVREEGWKEGWPQPVLNDSVTQWFAPVYGDLDGDGTTEIVYGSTGMFESKVYVWDENGNIKDGWPQNVNMNGGSTPALGDVDGDGDLEIVYKSSSFLVEKKSTIYVWNHDGTPLNENWPLDIPWEFISLTSPVLSDIDNDQKDEILVSTINLASVGGLKVYDENAIHKNGDWDFIESNEFDPNVADIDNDGIKEIVLTRGEMINDVSQTAVYIWDSQTGLAEGDAPFYTPFHQTHSSILADLNLDGYLDIVFAQHRFDQEDMTLYYDYYNDIFIEAEQQSFGDPYRADGFAILGTTAITALQAPLIADITGDTSPEVLDSGQCYWDHSLEEWFCNNQLYVWGLGGELLPGWPTYLANSSYHEDIWHRYPSQGGAIGDIDSDQANELITVLHTGYFSLPAASIGSYVFVTDIGGNPDYLDWPMYQGNMKHTGEYGDIRYANCGNGELDSAEGEMCDDGNVTSGDGCSLLCTIDYGWHCTANSPSECVDLGDAGGYFETDSQAKALYHYSGNTLMWWNASDTLHAYDFETQLVSNIHTGESYKYIHFDDDTVVWADSTVEPDIHFLDRATGSKTQITSDSSRYSEPKVSGDDIIWIEAGTSLYHHSISDAITTEISTGNISSADLENGMVVYEEKIDGVPEIFTYNLTDDTISQISDGPDMGQEHPKISDGKVIWHSMDDTWHVYDLTLQTIAQLETSNNLSITDYNDTIITWTDQYENVVFYDMLLDKEVLATTNGDSGPPFYSNNRIVYKKGGLFDGQFYQITFDRCGDANGDKQVNVGDAVYLINHIFNGGPAPAPFELGDANGDGDVNVGDSVYLINYVFSQGLPPRHNAGMCLSPAVW